MGTPIESSRGRSPKAGQLQLQSGFLRSELCEPVGGFVESMPRVRRYPLPFHFPAFVQRGDLFNEIFMHGASARGGAHVLLLPSGQQFCEDIVHIFAVRLDKQRPRRVAAEKFQNGCYFHFLVGCLRGTVPSATPFAGYPSPAGGTATPRPRTVGSSRHSVLGHRGQPPGGSRGVCA